MKAWRKRDRRRLKQWAGRRAEERERVYSTHLWGGPAGTTWASTKQRNEHRCWGVSTGLCLINWVFGTLEHILLCLYRRATASLFGAVLLLCHRPENSSGNAVWGDLMVKDMLIQPKQEIITSGILSYTLLKFIVISLSFAQFLNCLETKLGHRNF